MIEPKRKRRGRPEEKEEQFTLRKYVRMVISEFDQERPNEYIMDLALSKMTAAEREASYTEAVLALVASEVGLAGIEKEKPDPSGDLFAPAYFSRLLRTETGSIHMRESSWDHHQLMRERQIKTMRRINRKFEIDEQRREILQPIMDGTNINTEQAVWTLRPADEQTQR